MLVRAERHAEPRAESLPLGVQSLDVREMLDSEADWTPPLEPGAKSVGQDHDPEGEVVDPHDSVSGVDRGTATLAGSGVAQGHVAQ